MAAEPTTRERNLAARPGSSSAKRAAREKVIRCFYHGRPGLGDLRCEQDLKSVDLSQPVEVIAFPPPEIMYQYVRVGSSRAGNWFDPEGQAATLLGVGGAGRELVAFRCPDGKGLLSTALPIGDDWTDPDAQRSSLYQRLKALNAEVVIASSVLEAAAHLQNPQVRIVLN